jgi:hypothetical protein
LLNEDVAIDAQPGLTLDTEVTQSKTGSLVAKGATKTSCRSCDLAGHFDRPWIIRTPDSRACRPEAAYRALDNVVAAPLGRIRQIGLARRFSAL